MPEKKEAQDKLTNKQKAALFLISLDSDTAAKLMKSFTPKEVEDLTREIAGLKNISDERVNQVYKDYFQLAASNKMYIKGGDSTAKKFLEQSIGKSKAAEIIDKVKYRENSKAFDKLNCVESERIAKLLNGEHPQTAALILLHLEAEKAGEIFELFSSDFRNEVGYRMASIEKVPKNILTEIESVVNNLITSDQNMEKHSIVGKKIVAHILNNCDTLTSKSILEHFDQKDTLLAVDVKKMMFQFEDLVKIDNRGIQRILREVDKKDLAISLKVAEEALKQKIFSNMSERAQDLVKEEVQYMAPVRLKEVEAAQERIIEVVKNLEEQGEIVISGRGGKEEILV